MRLCCGNLRLISGLLRRSECILRIRQCLCSLLQDRIGLIETALRRRSCIALLHFSLFLLHDQFSFVARHEFCSVFTLLADIRRVDGKNTLVSERACIGGRKSAVCTDHTAVVDVARFCGNGILRKIFCAKRCIAQSGNRKKSGRGTDRLLNDSVRHREVFIGLVGRNLLHDAAPDGSCKSALFGSEELGVVVVACPYRCAVFRRVACKPFIVVIRGGTGLARDLGGSEIDRCSGALCDNILHGTGKKPCCCLLENPVAVGRVYAGVVDNDIAVVIRDLCVQLWLDIKTAVCDAGVGRVQFNVLHTLCDTAKGKGEPDVGVGLPVDDFVIDEGCESEIEQILISELRSNLFKCFDGDDVHRLLDSETERGETAVGLAVPVADLCAVRIGVGRIVLHGGQCEAGSIESGSVSGNDLEGGTGLTHCVRRTVQHAVRGLLAAAAHHRDNLSGVLILNGHGNLRLRSNVQGLSGDSVPGAHNGFFILICHCLRFFFAVEFKRTAEAVFLHPFQQHFRAVIGEGAFRIPHREPVIQQIMRVGRIVILVGAVVVGNLLYFGVLCGINVETAGIEKGICLCLRVSVVFKVLENLIRKSVDKIRVDILVIRLGVDDLNPGIDVVGHCLVVLILCDVALIKHISEDYLAAFGIVLRIFNRIIARRILRDARDDGALGERQVTDGFAEIAQRCSLHAERVVTEVDRIHVVEQDIILAHRLLKFDGKILLLNLSLDGLRLCFRSPVREDVVLDQLLRDGRSAL